jgi:hypothetical protein
MLENGGLPASVPSQPTRTNDRIFIDFCVSSGKDLEMLALCTKVCKDYG